MLDVSKLKVGDKVAVFYQWRDNMPTGYVDEILEVGLGGVRTAYGKRTFGFDGKLLTEIAESRDSYFLGEIDEIKALLAETEMMDEMVVSIKQAVINAADKQKDSNGKYRISAADKQYLIDLIDRLTVTR